MTLPGARPVRAARGTAGRSCPSTGKNILIRRSGPSPPKPASSSPASVTRTIRGVIRALRRTTAQEMGFVLPSLRIQDNLELPPDTYVLRVKEIEAARGQQGGGSGRHALERTADQRGQPRSGVGDTPDDRRERHAGRRQGRGREGEATVRGRRSPYHPPLTPDRRPLPV